MGSDYVGPQIVCCGTSMAYVAVRVEEATSSTPMPAYPNTRYTVHTPARKERSRARSGSSASYTSEAGGCEPVCAAEGHGRNGHEGNGHDGNGHYVTVIGVTVSGVTVSGVTAIPYECAPVLSVRKSRWPMASISAPGQHTWAHVGMVNRCYGERRARMQCQARSLCGSQRSQRSAKRGHGVRALVAASAVNAVPSAGMVCEAADHEPSVHSPRRQTRQAL